MTIASGQNYLKDVTKNPIEGEVLLIIPSKDEAQKLPRSPLLRGEVIPFADISISEYSLKYLISNLCHICLASIGRSLIEWKKLSLRQQVIIYMHGD